jgi:hypothetical protein
LFSRGEWTGADRSEDNDQHRLTPVSTDGLNCLVQAGD